MGYRNQEAAYGSTLIEEGKKNNKLVILDADLSSFTMEKMFEQAFPSGYYEVRVAEAGMTPVVVGLSSAGWTPLANSSAVFSTGRAYDQIRRTIATGNLNVKIVGPSAELSDLGDGAIHQAIKDMAYMYVIPNMTVACPADVNETVEAVKATIQNKGLYYLRLNRNDYDSIIEKREPFTVRKPSVLKQGTNVTMFTIGYMVSLALAAARELEGKISVRMVSVSIIRPLDQTMVIELTRTCKGVVTAEEYTVMGDPGSTATQTLARTGGPAGFVGINDTFGCSGHNYQEVLEHHGLIKEHTVNAVKTIREL